MLQDEAQCLVDFYRSRQALIQSTLVDLTQLQSSDGHDSYMLSRGNRALLQQLLLQTKDKLEGGSQCLSKISSGLPLESDCLSPDLEDSDYIDSSGHSSDSDTDS